MKFGGEAMIPFLARLLEVSLNSTTIASDGKKAILVPIYKGGRSIGSHKIQTHKLTPCGLQSNGTHYSRAFEASLK